MGSSGERFLWLIFLSAIVVADNDTFDWSYDGTPGVGDLYGIDGSSAEDLDWTPDWWPENATTDTTEIVCDEDQTKCPLIDNMCWNRCDCKMDCTDSSDEIECSNSSFCGFEHTFQCEKDSGGVFLGGFCTNRENSPNDHTYYCDGYQTCADGSDEPRNVFGFKCRVNPRKSGHHSDLRNTSCTVAQEFVTRWKASETTQQCLRYSICPEDETEVCYPENSTNLDTKKCFQCLDGTIIRTSQVCDRKIDCRDLSDECLCANQTEEIASFCTAQKQNTNCKGKFVCGDLNANNYTCVAKDDLCASSSECPRELCQEMAEDDLNFTCPSPGADQKIRARKCDGRPECRDFVDECSFCENKPDFCQIQFISEIMVGCRNDTVKSNDNQWLWICNGVKDCENGLDEEYCDWRQRCYNDSERYESFDTKYEKCDFMKDCDNWADEEECVGRFYCDDNEPPGLRKSQLNDGKLDCKNGEDECEYKENSFSSGQSMIKSGFIIACMWLMAIVALVGNAVVIYNCAKDLRETYRVTVRGRVGVCNKTLVLNLALADFLMGFYLLILGIKAVQYNETYCGEWQNWRSSGLCSGIGSFAMLSSQASVLIMVMMTTYRFYSVRSPFRAERLKARYLVAAVLVCWVPPIFLAFLPLRGHEMAFAFQSRTKLPYFDSAVVEKPVFHEFVLNAWTMANRSTESFGNTAWKDLFEKFCDLFGEVCGPDKEALIVEKWYGYYSADSVCLPSACLIDAMGGSVIKHGLLDLPDSIQAINLMEHVTAMSLPDAGHAHTLARAKAKGLIKIPTAMLMKVKSVNYLILLFPHVNDSGWDYTAGVIIFDFLAFVYILLAYTLMYICTVKRSSEPRNGGLVFGGRGSSFSSVDENRVREDRVIWQRISRLLFTDFLCWMPICITCMISLTNHNIPPLMYQISAAIFLPINSALNPLLYSNAVYQMIDRCFPEGFLGCVGLQYLSPCSRARSGGTRTPSTNSRANGGATDEMRISRDQLGPEAPGLSSSELDRNRNVTNGVEGRPLVGVGHKRTESDVVYYHTEPPPTANCPEIRNSIARSMARVSRIFSDRRVNSVQLEDRSTFPRRHRPKSQSTTSTSTTFTHCGQDYP